MGAMVRRALAVWYSSAGRDGGGAEWCYGGGVMANIVFSIT